MHPYVTNLKKQLIDIKKRKLIKETKFQIIHLKMVSFCRYDMKISEKKYLRKNYSQKLNQTIKRFHPSKFKGKS